MHLPVAAWDAGPAEEDVGGRLQQALALDHAPAVMLVVARADERLEHRGAGLLDLQEQRVAGVPPDEQRHPAAGADAADSHHLAGDVDEPVAIEQLPSVGRQALAVAGERLTDPLGQHLTVLGAEEIVDPLQHGRVVEEAQFTVHDRGQLGQRLEAGLRAGLADVALEPLERRLRRGGPRLDGDVLDAQPRTDDLQVAHRRQLGHPLAVPDDGGRHRGGAGLRLG